MAERRRWPRLPLAIPVFVRTQLDQDKEYLEFATALNVSAGGMLVALRRPLPGASRTLRAKVLRTEHAKAYNLIGMKFSRPLVTDRVMVKVSRKKQASM